MVHRYPSTGWDDRGMTESSAAESPEKTCGAEVAGYDGLFGLYCGLPSDHGGRHQDGTVEWWDTDDGPPPIMSVREAEALLRAERGSRLWVVMKEGEHQRPRVAAVCYHPDDAMVAAIETERDGLPGTKAWIEDHVLR